MADNVKTFKITRPPFSDKSTFELIRTFASPIITNEPAQHAIKQIDADYLTWDDFRNKNWAGADPEKTWGIVRLSRGSRKTTLPIRDQDGNFYGLDLSRHLQFLHEIDLEMGGTMLGIEGLGNDQKQQILRRNLIEESIASSKLEGANTSREVARNMIREGRKPQDHGQRMIANNHRAMMEIENRLKSIELTMDELLNLHRIVTADTLSNAENEGKLRETYNAAGKKLIIEPSENKVTYIAPDKEFVEAQLPKLIAFANDKDESGFIHPLIKAITIHFWLGLLHPFEDGNGRLARILFYWYMLRKGYWGFSYISLSERILKSPAQYADAFLYSEQDDYDLNYFVQYNIEKLKLARADMKAYLERKLKEEKQVDKRKQYELGLNDRQIKLLHYLSKSIDHSTSLKTYHAYNEQIARITAAEDLRNLVEKSFLQKIKNGRNVNYFPTLKAKALFENK